MYFKVKFQITDNTLFSHQVHNIHTRGYHGDKHDDVMIVFIISPLQTSPKRVQYTRSCDLQMDGWVAGWVAGWMDGWTDGWMDGWMARCLLGHKGRGLL